MLVHVKLEKFSIQISLRKQPSFFAPGLSGVSCEVQVDVCDLPPKIPYWWRKPVPNLVMSADWLDQ